MNINPVQFNFVQSKPQRSVSRPLCMKNGIRSDTISFSGVREKTLEDLVPKHKGIIYKKRGVGMFVATGAVEKIFKKRKQSFFETYIETLYEEAEKLKLSKDEIISMIERRFNHE